MNEPNDTSISIPELVRVLQKKWWLLLLCLPATLTPVLIFNHEATPVYRASSKVIFEDGEKMLDPGLSPLLGKDGFIPNQMEEMKTSAFGVAVAGALPAGTRNALLSGGPYPQGSDTLALVAKVITANLSVQPTKDTQILTIHFEAEEAGAAQTVANEIAEVLIRRNLEIRREKYKNLKIFVEQQFEDVKDRLEKTDTDLKAFKEKYNITSLDAESNQILQRITQVENLYNQVSSQKEELQEKLNAIKSRLHIDKAELSDRILRTTDPLTERLKNKLVELEVRYSNLQAQGFPEYNSKMVEIRNEITRTKEKLVQLTMNLIKEENIEGLLDPISQIRNNLQESIDLNVELQAIEAKERNLQSLLTSYSRRLRQLPNAEMKLIRLVRDKETLAKTYMTLLQEREQARIREAAELGNIRIIETAGLPTTPVRPRKLLNILVGVFSGILIGSLLIFIIEYFKDPVKSEDDIEMALGHPVVAIIPKLKHDLSVLSNSNGNGKVHKNGRNNTILLDEYNLLYSALSQKKKRPCAIMITSSIPNEGKSTIATMLALISARRGERTLLIDADLRRPSLHSFFKVPRHPGLTNLVVEFMETLSLKIPESDGNDETIRKQMIRNALSRSVIHTSEKNLLLLPCGFIPKSPMKAWSSSVWYKVVPELKAMTDLIIIDAPPIIGIPDATIISLYVDHILFCIESEGIEKRTLERSFRLFKNAVKKADEKIIGVILNKADVASQYGKYKYYNKYYNKHYKPSI